jgi:hypothetical protein
LNCFWRRPPLTPHCSHAPGTVRSSNGQQLTQAPNADPCAQAVRVEQHDKWLSMRRGDTSPLREDAKVFLDRADVAASQAHEGVCWHDLSLAEFMNSP